MNEPAFPTETFDIAGMTLRDYFAAKALPSILEQMDVCNGKELTNAAWIAYQMADKMMEARNVAQ
jgi:hypothetical protein